MLSLLTLLHKAKKNSSINVKQQTTFYIFNMAYPLAVLGWGKGHRPAVSSQAPTFVAT